MPGSPTIQPTLSVILPNYNHAHLINRALTALLGQTRAADEILIVDDGSTDNSLEVIGEIAARAPSIRLLANPNNIGVAATLQRGLDAARGKYVYFAASDDWVLPGFFELAIRRLEANPDAGLFCGEAILFDGRTNRPYGVRPAVRSRMTAGIVDARRAADLLKTTDNWIMTGSSMFRRDCVVAVGGLIAKLGSFADGYMARKVALKFGVFFEPQFTAAWAVFPGSVSRVTATELKKAEYLLHLAPELMAHDPVFPSWYAECFRNRWRFASCRLALAADPVDQEFVLAMGARSPGEKAQLHCVLSLPSQNLARLASLALLWYRLRPTTLSGLLLTMLAARWVRLSLGFRFRQLCSITAPNSGAS
jgi:glycosyltransferase involved in cell wall biosynthesis